VGGGGGVYVHCPNNGSLFTSYVEYSKDALSDRK
jgi:hypothetical protein